MGIKLVQLGCEIDWTIDGHWTLEKGNLSRTVIDRTMGNDGQIGDIFGHYYKKKKESGTKSDTKSLAIKFINKNEIVLTMLTFVRNLL